MCSNFFKDIKCLYFLKLFDDVFNDKQKPCSSKFATVPLSSHPFFGKLLKVIICIAYCIIEDNQQCFDHFC